MSDEMREAQAVYEATRTAAEEYAMEIEGLNALLEGGFISQDTFNRAVEQADEKLRDAAEASNFFKETAGNAFIDLAMGASTFEQAMVQVASSIAEAAFQAALFGQGPMAGLFGGSGGGLFSLIPGFAKGTDSAPGGLAMVGEDGPEIVNLPKGSRVHTAQETERMLSGQNARDLERIVTNPSPMAAQAPEVTVQNTNIITFDAEEARRRLITSPEGQKEIVKVMSENESA